MEFPFTVVFEPPSQTELRAVLRMRRAWVAGVLVGLAIGIGLVVWNAGQAEALAGVVAAPLELTSRPPGARVWLNGREWGHTPVTAPVAPGVHTLVFKAPDAIDAQYTVEVGGAGAAFEAVLWRRQPALMRLRSTLPGAVLLDVRVLSDGQLGLSIGISSSRQLQAWRLDPRTGAVQAVVTAATGTRMVLAPDGERVAYLGYDIGPRPGALAVSGSGADQASVVWLEAAGQTVPVAAWRAPVAGGEWLVDASWSPRADRLLVVSGRRYAGGAVTSRVWLVDAADLQAREMLSIPSEVVPGSATWSPDGRQVAFVAHAGALNALCVLGIHGGFRYVADLESSVAAPRPYAPASWSADSQRLLFVAPRPPQVGGAVGWLQPEAPSGLYIAHVEDPTPMWLGNTPLEHAVWREDGQVLGLGRLGADGGLDLRLVNGGGNGQRLVELALKPAAGYGVTWDLGHARLVVANPSALAGGVEFWLARLGLETEP